jgi:T5SS/PEP-CTERM-associated repeat protein
MGLTNDWNKPQGASFNSAASWSPTAVPVAADTASYNLNAAYTVTLPTHRTISRFLIGNDKLVLDLSGGGQLSATSAGNTSFVMGIGTGDVARMTVRNGTIVTVQSIMGASVGSSGSATISTGAIWNSTGSLTLGSQGTGNITVTGGGRVSASLLKLGIAAGSKGTALLSGGGSTLTITGNGQVGSNSPTATTGIGQMQVRTGSTASFGGSLDIRKGGTVSVQGGTLTSGSINNTSGGKLNFSSGVINVTKSDFLVGNLGPLSQSITLSGLQTINVTQNALLDPGALLLMQNGHFSAGHIENHGEIRFNGLSSTLVTPSIDSTGLIRGTGSIAADTTTSGELRAAGTDTLTFGGNVTSSGQINVLSGGAITFLKMLDNSGAITASGNLSLPAGMTNSGQVNYPSGTATIAWPFFNTDEGTVGINGTSTTFAQEVRQNGGLFGVAATALAVFAGDVSGAGDFDGGGTLNFQKSYSPGNSPATVHMTNTVVFDPAAELNLDVGPAQQTDQLIVDGTVQLGHVNIIFNPDFAPAGESHFTLLSASQIKYLDPENPLASISILGETSVPYEVHLTDQQVEIWVVPEPSAVLAGLLGGSTLLLRRRRSPR